MTFAVPHAERFECAVHGTVFADRAAVLHRLRPGDPLILVPDPPGAEVPAVWVHAPGGDVVRRAAGLRRCRAAPPPS